MGIVISSGDEWEETNAMLNAMSIENSKFLIGRSDQKFSDKKFPITEYYGAHYDSFDSISDYGGPRTLIYDLDSGDVNQNDRIDQADSAIYHDCEDYHHYHKHIDQHDPGNQQNSTATYLELKAAIKQLETINESLPEEQYSKLSVTRTDLSSPLNGWGDEDEDSGELLQSTNY